MFITGTPGVSSHLKLHTYEEGYLLPVLTGDELLFSHRHKGLLRQLRDLADMPADDFDHSYGQLLSNFMEFVQILPHKPSGILGSLLNYGLARTSAVFQKYCQLRKGQTTPLLKFAVFSAALLKDVGRVVTNQRIVLTDEQGDYKNDWNPFSGSMVGQTEFYKMYPISVSYLRIEAEITPLLARQLLPKDAFLWLSSDVAVFSDWLAALLNQEGVGAKEITWILAIIKRDDILAILNTIDGASIDMHESIATEEGEKFYRWLKEGIDKGNIEINSDNAAVHALSEGVLLEKKLFKQFADLTKAPVNFMVVYQQFGNLMGIAKKGGNDFMHAQYFSSAEAGAVSYSTFSGAQKTRAAHEGLVVSKDAVFINKALSAISSSTLKSTHTMISAQHRESPKSSDTLVANMMSKNHNSSS